MIGQNGFTIKELECISHEEAQFKSSKLPVLRSEVSKAYNENLRPNGALAQHYWLKDQGKWFSLNILCSFYYFPSM